MGWLSAGMGGGIGWILGGPVGGVIGAIIGSKFGGEKDNQEDYQIIFISCFVAMLAKIAKSDGVVSEEEIKAVSKFFDEMGLDADDRKVAIDLFNAAKSDSTTVYEYARQFSSIVDESVCEVMYAMLWDVARSDGKIHPGEDEILREIPSYLGLPASRYHEYMGGTGGNAQNNLAECYEIIGCSESDSDHEIKRRYRKTVAEYHPDTIQSKGLPEGFLRFANEQVQKINLAYETICRHRGIS